MKLKLFPLRLVAYPSKIVPLPIFEDRYKLLINECISTNSEFGIIYQNDKMLASVGCTVKVHKVLKRYKDGRMDILTKGNSLFKLIDKRIEHEIVTAKIELFSQSADDLAPFEKLRDKYLQVLMSIGLSENLDRHLLKSSSFSAFNSTLIGNLPCSSGNKSDGLANWKAPEAINKMWSVLIGPCLVLTVVPSIKGNKSL